METKGIEWLFFRSLKGEGVLTSSCESGKCHEDCGEVGWEMHFEVGS